MRWAKVAVVVGSLLLVVGFCVGVETPTSTTIAGRSYPCADVIPTGVLVSGLATGEGVGPDARTPAERRLDARRRATCHPIEQRARWAVWGALGLGTIVLLGGWTVLREREQDEVPPPRVPVGA